MKNLLVGMMFLPLVLFLIISGNMPARAQSHPWPWYPTKTITTSPTPTTTSTVSPTATPAATRTYTPTPTSTVFTGNTSLTPSVFHIQNGLVTGIN